MAGVWAIVADRAVQSLRVQSASWRKLINIERSPAVIRELWSLAGLIFVTFGSSDENGDTLTMNEIQTLDPQPVGFPLQRWTPRPRPPMNAMIGRSCRVEPLDVDKHASDLYEANLDDSTGQNWTYLPAEPFESLKAYSAWLTTVSAAADVLFHAIVDQATGRAIGVAAYLRIDPANGVIEVGHLNFSPRLQRRIAATEAMFLMMKRAFDELGYRRYEWKCDSLNGPSRRAAERLGFQFEGIFRQAVVYKGRNRDTAWFSIIDREWPALKSAFDQWLNPANFDESGQQKVRLSELTGRKST